MEMGYIGIGECLAFDKEDAMWFLPLSVTLKKVGDDFGVDLSGAGGTLGTAKGIVKIQVQVRDSGSVWVPTNASSGQWRPSSV